MPAKTPSVEVEADGHTVTVTNPEKVFFATRGGGEASHVGIFTGGDLFIHAPSRGRRIAQGRLSDPYYRERFLGARTYLG